MLIYIYIYIYIQEKLQNILHSASIGVFMVSDEDHRHGTYVYHVSELYSQYFIDLAHTC